MHNKVEQPCKMSMNLKKREKRLFYSFDGFICLHAGKNYVEESGHSQEEHKLNPEWDEARRLGCFRSLFTRFHGCRFQIGVCVSGRRVVHVGPEKGIKGIMLQYVIKTLHHKLAVTKRFDLYVWCYCWSQQL